MEFDENDAVDFMRNAVAAARNCDDNELLNIIDMIYDYLEQNGLLEIDADDDDDDDVDIDEVSAYVARMLKKDRGAKLDPALIPSLVEAYFDYETTLE